MSVKTKFAYIMLVLLVILAGMASFTVTTQSTDATIISSKMIVENTEADWITDEPPLHSILGHCSGGSDGSVCSNG